MIEFGRTRLARRLEAVSGSLAVIWGLCAFGYQLFAPIIVVHVIGVGGTYLRNQSYWMTFSQLRSTDALIALGINVLTILGIGYGVYAHVVRHSLLGRSILWIATVLLAADIALATIPLNQWNALHDAIWSQKLVAPILILCLVLASVACGAAAE